MWNASRGSAGDLGVWVSRKHSMTVVMDTQYFEHTIIMHLRWPQVAGAAGAPWSGPGTTPHLQSIFLGRCAEQIALQNPDLR